MLCRYDTMALKALDIFSVHGFPVGLVQCESNFTGIANGNGTNVGSGGWTNIVDKYVKAKRYCESPYEVRRSGSRNVRVPVAGERIGEMHEGRRRRITIRCRSATESELAPHSLDAVFTDPPYFGNVQYGELMDFCYVWLRRLAGSSPKCSPVPPWRRRAGLRSRRRYWPAHCGRHCRRPPGESSAPFASTPRPSRLCWKRTANCVTSAIPT